MATNASKFTGVQSTTLIPGAVIDVEQIRMDAEEMIEAPADQKVPAFIRLAQNNRAAVQRGIDYAKSHPLVVRASIAAGGLAAIVGPVAAEDVDPFGINETEVDAAFDLLNQHILPKVGETVSAMPAVIIPLVILVVLIIIMLFVPELLYSLIDMVKGVLKIKK